MRSFQAKHLLGILAKYFQYSFCEAMRELLTCEISLSAIGFLEEGMAFSFSIIGALLPSFLSLAIFNAFNYMINQLYKPYVLLTISRYGPIKQLNKCTSINNMISDSEEQGFHQSSLEMFTVKTRYLADNKPTKIRPKNAYLYRSPISIHHELPLYQYPKQVDNFQLEEQQIVDPKIEGDPLDLVEDNGEESLLLSDFFPKKLNCIYNRFRQNLILKRDTTIIIRNIASRVRNEQTITFHDLPDPASNSQPLLFNSNFEGGNLHCVFKDKATGFMYLLLQNDINTHGYNIWFHFRVKAFQAGTYHFVIVNMARPIKFENQLALLTLSSKNQQYQRSVGFRCCESRFRHCESHKKFWSLHYEYKFELGEDVYFSLCPPYSYSKLLRLIKQIHHPFNQSIHMSGQIVGKTQLGNYIPCIKFSSKEKASKNCILITARQHPCETVGSYVCQQIIKIMKQSSGLSRQLLESFTFFIIPMVNPDGVIHGNSRTNLIGYDINRNWDVDGPKYTKQTSQIWNYILQIQRLQYRIVWAFDLHGHSKELGYFSYFCEQSEPTLILNHLLGCKKYYDKQKCGFSLSRSKRQSIRGQLYYKLRIHTAVTVEISYYGFRDSNGSLVQYTHKHFHQIAYNILQSLLQSEKVSKNKAVKLQLLQEVKTGKGNDKNNKADTIQIQSQSDPEEHYLLQEQRNGEKLSIILGKELKSMTKTEPSNNNNRVRQNIYSRTNKYKGKSTNQIGPQNQCSYYKKQKGVNEQERSLAFYAGRRTLSPRSLRKYMEKTQSKSRRKRKIQVKNKSKLQVSSEHMQSQQYQYLKKSILIAKRNRDQIQKQKTHVGGFRTSYQVFGLRTIIYPTATSSGIEFENCIKSKKEMIKEIRKKELKGFRWNRRYGSETIED